MDLSEAEPSGVDLEEPGDEAWEEALGTLDERAAEAQAWAELRRAVDPLARPVVERAQGLRLGCGRAAVDAPASGCIVSLPQAREQSVHRDGPHAGLVNAFVPLVDIHHANGGTRLLPRTHKRLRQADHGGAATPLLRAGEILLFDYRCLHHGRANTSDQPRPVAYVVYAADGVRDRHNFPEETSLRSFCTSFRERNARLDRTLEALRAHAVS